MFAELAAIDGSGHRTSWMLGAASIVLAATKARALTVLSLRMRIALIAALSAALASGVLSYADVQAALLDDEWLAAFSAAAVTALFALAAVTTRTIFRDPELASGRER